LVRVKILPSYYNSCPKGLFIKIIVSFKSGIYRRLQYYIGVVIIGIRVFTVDYYIEGEKEKKSSYLPELLS